MNNLHDPLPEQAGAIGQTIRWAGNRADDLRFRGKLLLVAATATLGLCVLSEVQDRSHFDVTTETEQVGSYLDTIVDPDSDMTKRDQLVLMITTTGAIATGGVLVRRRAKRYDALAEKLEERKVDLIAGGCTEADFVPKPDYPDTALTPEPAVQAQRHVAKSEPEKNPFLPGQPVYYMWEAVFRKDK